MSIVNWCNNNQGFLSAIFSFCTIIISVVAISISINVAKIQYKTKLSFEGGFETNDQNKLLFNASITNIGNRNIVIRSISVRQRKDNLVIGSEYFEKNENLIIPLCSIDIKIDIFDGDTDKLNEYLDINKIIYIACYDSAGKEYIGKNCFARG